MRVLLAMPHIFSPVDGSLYSSQSEHKRELKRASLERATVENLRRHGGDHWIHASLGHNRPVVTRRIRAKAGVNIDLQVFSCKDANQLMGLDVPGLEIVWLECEDFRSVPWIASRTLLEQAPEYDIVGYLEDDILIEDAHFFEKILMLAEQYQKGYAFLPHRCEHIKGEGDVILSGDPDGGRPDLFWDTGERLKVKWPFGPVEFYRATNPHSGCYFLTRKQAMVVKAYWEAREWKAEFQLSGPLEQAASGVLLPVLKVMKPVPTDYRFLMVRHLDELWKRHPKEGVANG